MTNPPIPAPKSSASWTLLQQLLDRESLSRNQAAELMQGWLNEAIPPEISGAILAALHFKGVSADELAGEQAPGFRHGGKPLANLFAVPILQLIRSR